MRWAPPDPNWTAESKRAYRNMILATRRAAVQYNVTPQQLMVAAAERILKKKWKNYGC